MIVLWWPCQWEAMIACWLTRGVGRRRLDVAVAPGAIGTRAHGPLTPRRPARDGHLPSRFRATDTADLFRPPPRGRRLTRRPSPLSAAGRQRRHRSLSRDRRAGEDPHPRCRPPPASPPASPRPMRRGSSASSDTSAAASAYSSWTPPPSLPLRRAPPRPPPPRTEQTPPKFLMPPKHGGHRRPPRAWGRASRRGRQATHAATLTRGGAAFVRECRPRRHPVAWSAGSGPCDLAESIVGGATWRGWPRTTSKGGRYPPHTPRHCSRRPRSACRCPRRRGGSLAPSGPAAVAGHDLSRQTPQPPPPADEPLRPSAQAGMPDHDLGRHGQNPHLSPAGTSSGAATNLHPKAGGAAAGDWPAAHRAWP